MLKCSDIDDEVNVDVEDEFGNVDNNKVELEVGDEVDYDNVISVSKYTKDEVDVIFEESVG